MMLETTIEASGAMFVYHYRHCGADGVQGIERIRIPRLPFSKKNRKGNRTRPLASIDALRQWAKAQAVMLYGGEHLLRGHGTCQKSRMSCPLTLTCWQDTQSMAWRARCPLIELNLLLEPTRQHSQSLRSTRLSFHFSPAVEHDELWVHEGFHDVSQAIQQTPSALMRVQRQRSALARPRNCAPRSGNQEKYMLLMTTERAPAVCRLTSR